MMIGSRLRTLTAILPLMVGLASAALAEDEWGKTLEKLGRTLESAAQELQARGASEQVLRAGAQDAFAATGERVAALGRTLGHLASKRQALAKGISQAETGVSKALHKELVQAEKDAAAFEQATRGDIKLLNDTMNQLERDRPAGGAEVPKSMDALFASLGERYPHWKGDIGRIEERFRDSLTDLTMACAKGTACPQPAKADLDAVETRIRGYAKMIDELRSQYGDEIAGDVGRFVFAHPHGLLADVAVLASVRERQGANLADHLAAAEEGLAGVLAAEQGAQSR